MLFIGDGVVQHIFWITLHDRKGERCIFLMVFCYMLPYCCIQKNIENACLHAITREKVVSLYSLTVSITLARVCMYVPIKKPLIIYH